MRRNLIFVLIFIFAGLTGESSMAQKTTQKAIQKTIKQPTRANVHYRLHTIVSGETLTSIARANNVSVAKLKAVNPVLESEFKAGMAIYIPVSSAVLPSAKNTSTKSVSGKPTVHTFLSQLVGKKDGTFHVGVFLPFSQTDKDKESAKNANFLHFYEGLVIAANEYSSAGLKLDLQVKDTKGEPAEGEAILKKKDFSGLNLIIGPVYEKEQPAFSALSVHYKIPMVSPLSASSSVMAHNPFFFQINPEKKYLIERTADFVAKYRSKNIIVLVTHQYKTGEEKLFLQRLRSKMGGKPFHVYLFGKTNSALLKILASEKGNVVAIPTQNGTEADHMIEFLAKEASRYDIELVGTQMIAKAPNITYKELHPLRFKYLAPYHIDEQDKALVSFGERFKETYHGEPNQYAYQGYDVGTFFFGAMKKYGKRFMTHAGEKRTLLQSTYLFKRLSSLGGYMNTSLYVMEYESATQVVNKGTF